MAGGAGHARFGETSMGESINSSIAELVNPSPTPNGPLLRLGFAGWVPEEGVGSRRGGRSWKVR